MAKRITKVSYRNGRSNNKGQLYNPNHNFNKELRDTEAHIEHALTENNIYFKIQSDGTWQQVSSFDARAYELSRYDEIFGEGQQAKNDRYIKSGHPEDCKSIADMYYNKKTAPMETIVQVANMDDIKNGKFTFQELEKMTHKVAQDTFKELQKKFGKNIELLDYCLHVDEGIPHAHIRYVYKVRDKHNFIVPNQSQALKEMGFGVSKAERTKFENSLIKFSDYVREHVYQTCERNYDIEVDREVVSRSHRQEQKLRGQIKAERAQSIEDVRFDKMQQELEELQLQHSLEGRTIAMDDFKKVPMTKNRIVPESVLETLVGAYNANITMEQLKQQEERANVNKRVQKQEKEIHQMAQENETLKIENEDLTKRGTDLQQKANARVKELKQEQEATQSELNKYSGITFPGDVTLQEIMEHAEACYKKPKGYDPKKAGQFDAAKHFAQMEKYRQDVNREVLKCIVRLLNGEDGAQVLTHSKSVQERDGFTFPSLDDR